MKNENIVKWIIPVIFMVGLTSCLKNKNEQPDFSSATPIVEIPVNNPTGDGSPNSLQVSLVSNDTPSTFNFFVNYAAAKANATDLKLTLTIDTSYITKYNIAHPTATIIPMPPEAYTIPLSVTIPAGQRKLAVPVILKSTLLDPSATSGLPIVITDASGVVISKNFGAMILRVGVKNIYDGLYTVTGTMVDQANAAITGRYPTDYYLQTESANSNSLFDFDYSGTWGHQITSGGGASYYGSFSPIFTFDPNGNITSVVNYYGQPAGNGRSARLDPTGENKFITGKPGEVGSVFKVKYIMSQPTGTDRTFYDETFTKKGPRP
jgi:hypothetical protein